MTGAALTRILVFGALVAVVLTFGVSSARAAYTAQIVTGTLQITGNGASYKLALRLQAGVPTVLEINAGDNGTADFSFDRSLFTAINVSAGGGNDLVRIDQSNGAFTDEAITVDGGAGNDTLLGASGAEAGTTRSKARTARTRSTSTARTSPRASTCPRTAGAYGSSATSPTSR